jgi:CheY-like chemotaxis protein
VNLNDIVSGLEKMLRRVVGEQVQLAIVPGHALSRVKADAGQMEQVLMNLVVNGRDAMPEGGRITIETTNVELVAGQVPDCPSMPGGEYVVLGVADTGTGMDSNTRERIFEPFFTTKERGKGTGLGLAVVYGIVAQSAGYIAVDTELGKGTLFRIFLPATQDAVAPSLLPPPSIVPGGSETILLVEDDEQLRIVLATILRRRGYHVIDAQNAGEALLACETSTQSIELLLTDVAMPRMTGPELAARLRVLRPAMKVVYMSGHLSGMPVDPAPSSELLEKPIAPDLLLARVREALDRTVPSSKPPA